MPVPPNTTAATAIVIPSLPYTTTQDVRDGSTNYTVFYTYTTSATDEVLELWGFGGTGSFNPLTSVWSDTLGSSYRGINNYREMPIYFAVSPSTQYWFRFNPASNTPNPAVVSIRVATFTQGMAPAGSLFINDASSANFPAALMSSSTGAVVQYILDFPGGEQMVQLEDGTLLVADEDTNTYKIYTGEYVFVASIGDFSNRKISSNRTTLFYVGNTADSTATTYTPLGTATGDSWTLAVDPVSLAPSRDDAILYYADGSSGAAIRRWDISTVPGAALSNLVAGVAGYTVREIFVLADNTILVLRRQVADTHVFTILHYSAAGATLNDYSALLTASTSVDSHLALDNDDPTYFWSWIKIAGGFSLFQKINVSTGAAAVSFDAIHYTSGSSDETPVTATPDSYVGHSESCTFVITRFSSVTPSEFTDVELIPRRQRRCPFLSAEQVWLFFQRLEIVLESGLGLTSGQGSDPQVMLRWSDDGGHTWSDEHWASAGERGEYARRVFWTRMGRSRTRCYELTVSDPIGWQVLEAVLQIEKGSS